MQSMNKPAYITEKKKIYAPQQADTTHTMLDEWAQEQTDYKMHSRDRI